MFVELIAYLASMQGIKIGVFASILKTAYNVRAGNWSYVVIVSDAIMAIALSWFMWDILKDSGMGIVQETILIVLVALNGFAMVGMVMNVKHLVLMVKAVFFHDKESIDNLANAITGESPEGKDHGNTIKTK